MNSFHWCSGINRFSSSDDIGFLGWDEEIVVHAESFKAVEEEEIAVASGGLVEADNVGVEFHFLASALHQVNLDLGCRDLDSDELVSGVLHWVVNRNEHVFSLEESLSDVACLSGRVDEAVGVVSVIGVDSELFLCCFLEDWVQDHL